MTFYNLHTTPGPTDTTQSATQTPLYIRSDRSKRLAETAGGHLLQRSGLCLCPLHPRLGQRRHLIMGLSMTRAMMSCGFATRHWIFARGLWEASLRFQTPFRHVCKLLRKTSADRADGFSGSGVLLRMSSRMTPESPGRAPTLVSLQNLDRTKNYLKCISNYLKHP